MTKAEQIVQKVGKNSTGTGKVANPDIEFDEVTLSDGSSTFSFYTYGGEVFILDNEGSDMSFEDYSDEDQTLIYNSIMKKE